MCFAWVLECVDKDQLHLRTMIGAKEKKIVLNLHVLQKVGFSNSNAG